MYNGRHCLISDYQLLEKVFQNFILIINRDNFELKEVEKHLHTFSEFDFEIASKIRIHLEKFTTNKEKEKRIIIDLIDELKNNVLVDIREHN